MKIRILLLYITIIYSASTVAQWNKIEQITSPYISSALFSGDNIFVGSDTLYISKDRGLTWQTTIPAGNPIEITALHKINNLIFLGTYGDGVFISSNNGDNWKPINSGLGVYANYAKKFVSSGDTVFYGTEGGGVYSLKIGLETWQAYNENLPSNIAWTTNDIAVTNNNIVLSAGASGFYYFRPKGSNEWTESRIQTPIGTYTTPNTFLTIENIIFSGSRAGIYRSMDNGINWDSVGISAVPLNVVSFAKDGNRIYVGYSTFVDFYVWYSDDLGDTWNPLDHQYFYLKSIYVYDNKIWAATNDGLYFNQLEPTSVETISNIKDFKLFQNYPNPFNPITKIKWQSNEDGYHSLIVYDVLGNKIKTLVDDFKPAGKYEVEFEAVGLASGIYFYKLKTISFTEIKKMILLK